MRLLPMPFAVVRCIYDLAGCDVHDCDGTPGGDHSTSSSRPRSYSISEHICGHYKSLFLNTMGTHASSLTALLPPRAAFLMTSRRTTSDAIQGLLWLAHDWNPRRNCELRQWAQRFCPPGRIWNFSQLRGVRMTDASLVAIQAKGAP